MTQSLLESDPKPTTQSRHPWRAVIRTIFQIAVGFAAAFPMIVALSGDSWKRGQLAEYVSVGLTVAAVLTRAMANPGVESFLRKVAPWLAAGKIETDTAITVAGMAVIADASRDYAMDVWRQIQEGQIPGQPVPEETLTDALLGPVPEADLTPTDPEPTVPLGVGGSDALTAEVFTGPTDGTATA